MKRIFKKIAEIYSEQRFKENPTCYFYELSQIRQNIRRLQNTMPDQVCLYYAMKANPHKQVMECICQEEYISGIEIASVGELATAQKCIAANQIIFTGPGKTDYELEKAIADDIRFINIESITEAVRINNIAKRLGKDVVDVLVRINLNYCVMDGAESMSGCSTKMGIDEDKYVESVKFISSLEHIRVKGIHVFAASGVLNYESLLKVDEYIFELVHRTECETGRIEVIDLGGGLGIDYSGEDIEFDTASYGLQLGEMLKHYQLCDREIIMELGTYLVGNAGYYTAKIVDIKQIKGKKHIIIAGGVNHMGLPLEMQRKHPLEIIPMHEPRLYPNQPFVHREFADISGPLCMVSDKLSWDDYVEHAEIGDIVVYRQAGAYCYGEGMHQFLMHPLPDEIIIDESVLWNE